MDSSGWVDIYNSKIKPVRVNSISKDERNYIVTEHPQKFYRYSPLSEDWFRKFLQAIEQEDSSFVRDMYSATVSTWDTKSNSSSEPQKTISEWINSLPQPRDEYLFPISSRLYGVKKDCGRLCGSLPSIDEKGRKGAFAGAIAVTLEYCYNWDKDESLAFSTHVVEADHSNTLASYESLTEESGTKLIQTVIVTTRSQERPTLPERRSIYVDPSRGWQPD